MGSLWWKIVFYLGVFVFAFYMAFHEYSPLLTTAIVAVAVLLTFLPYLHSLLLETRIDRLETFVRKQKKTPAIYINYVFANRLEDEAKSMMEQLMLKYKQPDKQAIFRAAYGVYRKDWAAVREAVPYIRMADYRAYYEAILLLEDGEDDLALETIRSIKKPWMRSALLAEKERRAGHHEAASKHATEAIHAVRGVQRYVLYKEYEKVLPQAIEPFKRKTIPA